MATIEKLEDLRIWKEARLIAADVYAACRTKPLASDWMLRDQIRKSAISVTSNIAEGFERGGNREFIQFLSIAKGSLGELRAQIFLACDIDYLEPSLCKDLQERAKLLAGGIARLIQVLGQSQHPGLRFINRPTDR